MNGVTYSLVKLSIVLSSCKPALSSCPVWSAAHRKSLICQPNPRREGVIERKERSCHVCRQFLALWQTLCQFLDFCFVLKQKKKSHQRRTEREEEKKETNRIASSTSARRDSMCFLLAATASILEWSRDFKSSDY